MKLSLKSLMFFLTLLIFITSSMDIFMNIKIGGFSVRFVFFPILLIIFFYIIKIIISLEKIKFKFLALKPALVWILFLIIFIPNTTIIVRNIAYIVWLTIYFAFIPSFSSFFYIEDIVRLIKIYISSFTLVAIFAIFQFFLGIIDVDILIQQWWKNGLPRANGFSYEPSYLATYLILGWVICAYLMINKSIYVKYFNLKWNILIITIAIVLSGSRMGIIFTLLVPIVYILISLKSLFFRFRIDKLALKYVVILSVLIATVLVYFTYNFNQALVYLNGLGFYGTVNHSYLARSNDQSDTFKAFLNSPIIGYSLGGIPTQIAKIRGVVIVNQEEAKNHEGLNIFAEVLAASGIFGFCFFIAFLYLIFRKNLKLISYLKHINPEWGKIIAALLLAFFCELLILIFNQNILRAYLWVHIAVLNCSFFVFSNLLMQHYKNVDSENKPLIIT
ncbi:MAG: hypothetical protein EAZ07_02375 [Cytophagales bacterium]|nr:MAG: hypothetical protein EAZ07_02375 [Cytophagales bacterium]